MRFSAYMILSILVLISLALNVFVIASFLDARQATIRALAKAQRTLVGIENTVFETTVLVNETIPIYAEIPFQREWSVPVDTQVPIHHDLSFQETLQIPINLPLFKRNVDVPVSATIPIDLVVPIHTEVPIVISETFPVSTEVQIELTVPVAIRLSDTSLPQYADYLRSTLKDLQQYLEMMPQIVGQRILDAPLELLQTKE